MIATHRTRSRSISRPLGTLAALLAAAALAAGCTPADRATPASDGEVRLGQPVANEQPLGQVTEFDGFTLRANVSPSDFLPDTIASRYGIQTGPDLSVLNLVVLQTTQEGPSVPVRADVSAHYESLIGHATTVDMRAVEADGQVSYIGTFDTSGQRVFRFVIQVVPQGAEQALEVNFEVQLPVPAAQ